MKPKKTPAPRRIHPQKSARLAAGGLLGAAALCGQTALAADFAQNVTFASPAVIDPPADGGLNVTVTATGATAKATLEALAGFRVIQNFTAIPSPGTVQSLGNNYILNATDAPTTPDLKLSYFVGPAPEDALATAAANTVVVASNSGFQSSLGSSIRIQGNAYNSAVGIRIEAGSWDGTTFTSGVVKAMGFTVNGPFNRMVGDSATVTYFDSSDNVLSTQVITSAPAVNVSAYTGHEVTSGPLIKYATVSFKGDTVSTSAILSVDDIAFVPDPSSIAQAVKWRVGDGDWDTANTNWLPIGGGAPVKYVEGADVTFDDSASGAGTVPSPINVSLVNTRSPASMTSGGTKSYNLSDGGGSIDGGGSLTVSGAGVLTLGTDNTFSGPTTVAAGTLRLNSPLAVQGTTVSLTGGSLVFGTAGGTDFTVGGLAAATSGAGYDVALQNEAASAVALTLGTSNANTTYAGVLSGPGSLIKNGSGILTLTNANTYTGDTTLQGTGVLKLSNAEALGTTGQVFLNSNQFGAGITTFEINGGINFSRPITVDSTSGREHFSSTGGANTLSSPITILNGGTNTMSLDAAGGAGNVFTVSGGITATDGPFIGTLAVRGTSGGHISGVINAPGATFDILQSAANVVWTVSSTGNSWAITRMSMSANGTPPADVGFAGGKLILGANNALCTTAKVQWPTANNNIAGGTLDLAGFNQTVAGIEKAYVHASDTPNSIATITNSSATSDSTLTLAGLNQTAVLAPGDINTYIFTGRLSDGPTRKLHLVLDSAGKTQWLRRLIAYTGDTTVVEGTLRVDLPAFADTSTLTIGNTGGSNAVLDLPTAGPADVVGSLIIDGVPQGPGTYDVNNSNGAITGLGSIQVVGATDYDAWVALYQPGFTNSLPGDDQDGDGLTNDQEYVFGLNPKSGSSVSPIATGLTTGGQFSYTRRATSGRTYKIFTSTDLGVWTEDEGASQTLGTADGFGVQSVAVTLTATPVNGKLFARVQTN